MEESIKRALDKLNKKYNFNIPIRIVDGVNASTQPGWIQIGKDNPTELLEVIVMHEAYHIIFNIDQTEEFKQKDKCNPHPYFKSEIIIWNKIKEDFPELTPFVDKAIGLEKEALGIK